MSDLYFNNGIGEFDFTSIGERFHVSREVNLPNRIDFGEHEKQAFIEHKADHISREVAAAILDKSVVEVRRDNKGIKITADFILISPKEYYEMLNIVHKHFGGTIIRYQK